MTQSSQEAVVIIGASHAGLAGAEVSRKSGIEGDIIFFKCDGGLPLRRPP